MSVSLADIVKHHVSKVQAEADKKTAQMPDPAYLPPYFRSKIVDTHPLKYAPVYTLKYSS